MFVTCHYYFVVNFQKNTAAAKLRVKNSKQKKNEQKANKLNETNA